MTPVDCSVHSVTLSSYEESRELEQRIARMYNISHSVLPLTLSSVEFSEISLATVHIYLPFNILVTVRVCVYCAVTGSSNTVSIPLIEILYSYMVQVTVVAGPPVEIQVRVN